MRSISKRSVCAVGAIALAIGSVVATASANNCNWWVSLVCCSLHKDYTLLPPCEDNGTVWTCRGALHPTIRSNAGTFVKASHGWNSITVSNGPVQCQFLKPLDCGTLPGTCIFDSTYTVVNCDDYPEHGTDMDCPGVGGG